MALEVTKVAIGVSMISLPRLIVRLVAAPCRPPRPRPPQAHEQQEEVKLEAVQDNNVELVTEILGDISGLKVKDDSAAELSRILQEPHFQVGRRPRGATRWRRNFSRSFPVKKEQLKGEEQGWSGDCQALRHDLCRTTISTPVFSRYLLWRAQKQEGGARGHGSVTSHAFAGLW